MKGFKEGMKGSNEEADAAKGASAEAPPPGKIGGQTIEGEVRKETSAKS